MGSVNQYRLEKIRVSGGAAETSSAVIGDSEAAKLIKTDHQSGTAGLCPGRIGEG